MARRRYATETSAHRKNTIFFVFCEGRRSEIAYFQSLNKLQFVIDSGFKFTAIATKVDPQGTLDYAVDYFEKDRSHVPSQPHQIVLVFDHDLRFFTPEQAQKLQEIKHQARDRGFEIGFSNPCFEVWYLFHVHPQSAYLPNYDAVKPLLEKHLQFAYDKKSVPKQVLKEENVKRAVVHAAQMESFHVTQGCTDPISPKANPSSTLYKLLQKIMDAPAS